MALSNFWQLVAGLGIFLYGMFHLENAVKKIGGRSFKIFLKTHTNNKLKSIFSGTVITGFLQSSSVVNLMVLTFVGAEMISMRNALGLVFGSNIGGTFNSWIVALVGFKFDFEKFTLPIIGLAGIGLVVINDSNKVYQVVKFIMGFGLLFLGLGFMKESMELLVKSFDFRPFLNYNGLFFVFIGFIFTSLVQTSAATVVITLSALSIGAIPLFVAVSVVLGAELGTTIKVLIGAIGGIPSKKRLALANFIFNFCVTFLGYSLMLPIIFSMRSIFDIHDPLIILVVFQTLINILGVAVFYPFIDRFAGYLERIFSNDKNASTYFIQDANQILPEATVDVFEKESLLFLHRVIELNLDAFHIGDLLKDKKLVLNPILDSKNLTSMGYLQKYEMVKRAEGEILLFYSRIRKNVLDEKSFMRLNQLLSAVRNAMYSAKGMKDIRHDREDFHNTGNDYKYEQYKLLQEQLRSFYIELNEVLVCPDRSLHYEKLIHLIGRVKKNHELSMNSIYKKSEKDIIPEIDISTLLNVNRAIYSSSKAIVFSLSDFLLDAAEAEKFCNVPIS